MKPKTYKENQSAKKPQNLRKIQYQVYKNLILKRLKKKI